jgi:type IV pilus assembly protein PilX
MRTIILSRIKIARKSGSLHCAWVGHAQHGVVLIIALLMLVVISLVASLSIRNATSSEAVTGGVRTTQLAMQAAEIALRYCESSVAQIVVGGTPSFTTTFDSSKIDFVSTTPQWTNTAVWDSTNTFIFVLPATSVNGAGVSTTYSRMPECMVQNLPQADSTGSSAATRTYVVTARGFGPEVEAVNSTRSRPRGSEVWLQSTIGF